LAQSQVRLFHRNWRVP